MILVTVPEKVPTKDRRIENENRLWNRSYNIQ